MMKQTRPQIPDWLNENWEKWGNKYKENQIKGTKFNWFSHNGETVNHKLLPTLKIMTANHCSFCDGHPMTRIGNTIEHFRPKSIFPELSYQWENLFLCCGNCQKKGDQFNELLLKPDEIDYEFHRYFDYNFETGCLRPNPYSDVKDQHRARITLIIYGLNNFDRPDDRRMTFNHYNTSDIPLNERSYRFIFE